MITIHADFQQTEDSLSVGFAAEAYAITYGASFRTVSETLDGVPQLIVLTFSGEDADERVNACENAMEYDKRIIRYRTYSE